MSFIGNGTQGTVYAPGYFLAREECTRLTKQISQEGATVTDSGAKYVKMGTAYPSNDGNAIGIVYEDVDVSTGDMPGSVVTKGVVIEDRLPVTGTVYDAETVAADANPMELGLYESDGQTPPTYTLTTDTEKDSEKTYYKASEQRLTSAAKSALEALGFEFVSETTVTRPY